MGQPAAIPGLLQTGVVCALTEKKITIRIDNPQDEALELACASGECFTLKWHDRTLDGDFVVIAKAWVSYWDFTRKLGKRIVRVQRHRITGGVLGRRWITSERHNGKLVKGK